MLTRGIRSATDITVTQGFSRDIQIAIASPGHMRVRARLDTQCEKGNWISRRLVDRLGRTKEIIVDDIGPALIDASGHSIIPCGSILLDWRWGRGGTILKQCKFFVFPPESEHLDVIFGADFIKTEGLFSFNEDAFLTLTQHQKETDGNVTLDHYLEKQRSLTFIL